MPAATRASSAERASACTAAAAGSAVSWPRACSAGAADTGPVAGGGASLIRALAAPARTAAARPPAGAGERGRAGAAGRASGGPLGGGQPGTGTAGTAPPRPASRPARARRCEPARRAARPAQARRAGPGRARAGSGRLGLRGPGPVAGHGDGCGDACPEYRKPPEPPRPEACGNERAGGCGRTALAACTVLLLCCPDGQRMPSPPATSRDAPNGGSGAPGARVDSISPMA